MRNIILRETQKKHPLSCLGEYLFPRGCAGCGGALLYPRDAYYGICGNCRKLFSSFLEEEKSRCEICGRPLVSEKKSCLVCRELNSCSGKSYNNERGNESPERPLFEKTLALFPYTGKFKQILGAYKFEGFFSAGNFLAQCLDAGLDYFDGETFGEAAWVPVPPRPGKIRRQGWDQIDHLAKALERDLRHIPVRRCLSRLPSVSQKELKREERKSNLKGRIRCVKRPPETAIIFDDVITTGATLASCASALLEGGASRVYGVCLFYD